MKLLYNDYESYIMRSRKLRLESHYTKTYEIFNDPNLFMTIHDPGIKSISNSEIPDKKRIRNPPKLLCLRSKYAS